MSKTSDRAQLTSRLRWALAVPLVLLTVVGVTLGAQVQRLVTEASWVDHTDQIIGTATSVVKQIVDQETGVRGFLLTKDPALLEPFDRAHPLQGIALLRSLVSDNPTQAARVDELRRKYDAWLRHAEATTRGEDESDTGPGIHARKAQMDSIRETVDGILEEEHALMRTRKAASSSSLATTKIFFVSAFCGLALILAVFSRRQLASIADTFTDALKREQESRLGIERLGWQRTGQMKLSEALLGDIDIEQLCDRALGALVPFVNADIGTVYTVHERGWKRRAGYAIDNRVAGTDFFDKGEGLIGTTAARGELAHLRDLPGDYLALRSGTGARHSVEVVVVPARLEGTTVAVLELGFMRPVEDRTIELLGRIGETVAIAVRSSEYKQRLRDLLEESQTQSEELQAQQEELRVSNEELEEQTNAVRIAQSESEHRQKALEQSNARLEEQTQALRDSQREVLDKAAEVERASRYKSEFLANMSHELRTPLNSTLILAKLLADNVQGNLNAEQVEFAETISSAGNELLDLINDVLDLSKIEAGKVDLRIGEVSLRRIAESLRRGFEPIAQNKGLALEIQIDDGVPQTLQSDSQRVEQVLKNLLSNAIKFTDRGSVSMRVSTAGDAVRFQVSDTGIGIATEQQDYIFEAFRQAEGGMNRKYGGTGLGLSICRDLAKLLGGTIEVRSALGKGSIFTFALPIATGVAPIASAPPPSPAVAAGTPARALPAFADDRSALDRQKRVVLVVEDDARFAKILLDLAHEQGFQCLVAPDADSGIVMAKEYLPSAVLLDMRLPDHPGLSVLDRLKNDPRTRHLPVHVLSVDDHAQTALSMGAIGYTQKPVDREQLVATFRKLEERLDKQVRRVLLVEDDRLQRESLCKLLAGHGTEIIGVGTVAEALASLQQGPVDCVVTDLTLPDASGFELLERMGADSELSPPVIVYTGRSLSPSEEQQLRRFSSSIIVKGARSPERLLDEVTLFLHRVESELPPEQQRMLKHARDRETVFSGKHLLIVEDDVRNIFATSRVLEPKGMKISIARNGREALSILEATPSIDIVLMDIMMPEMDGIEAMERIRAQPKWRKLPIIALTAKAMKDDQERCLKAGASDYIAKPLDVEMLLSLLRVWMPK